jgi:hypothetical protein
MEEYLANKGTFESGFLCMDGNTREDAHIEQPEEKTNHGDKSGNQSTICFFTVRSHVHFGMLSSVGSGCIGLCLVGWSTCMLVGGREGALRVRLCGR